MDPSVQMELCYEVATKFQDTTKTFHTLIQALDYYDKLKEEAVLWDYTGEHPDMIKNK